MIGCGEVDLLKRLRGLITNQLGYARVGSNPAVDVSPQRLHSSSGKTAVL